MKINSIKIDNKINPIGIDNSTPYITWTFAQDGFENQKAYKITVSAKKYGDDDMWDSKWVYTPDCICVKYAGKPLESTCVYYVELTVKNEKGELATAKASFEMGLLKKEDWKGTWAGSDANFQGNSTVVRRLFSLERADVVRARAYVLGLGYHELFINGEKIGDAVLAPSFCDYNKRMYYKTYDITPNLVAGNNCIAVELGYGWFGRKCALIQYFVEFSDGSKFEDYSAYNGLWWVGGGAYRTNSVYGGEIYDAALAAEKKDWKDRNTSIYLDDDFMIAFFPLVGNAEFCADTLEPIRVCGEYKSTNVRMMEKNRFVYDFGVNISGWVRLKVKGNKGDSVTIRYAEVCDEKGEINQVNLRSAKCKDVYILSGNGEEIYVPRFTYHGFRFAEVTLSGDSVLLDIVAQHVHTDVKKTGNFYCSDEYLNRLHDCVLRTEENNMHSLMTDCPQRDERLNWLNDLTSRLYQNVYNYDISALLKKTSVDISDTQDENGTITDTAPFVGGIRPADPVSISYLLCGYKAYRYYGDISVIEQHYDGYRKWVGYLLCQQKDYILDLSYYADWVVPELYAVTDKTYVSSVYLNWYLALMARFAGLLGKKEDEAEYKKMRDLSTQKLNAVYYNREDYSYANGTQAANAMALSVGIVPEADRAKVAENIAKSVLDTGLHSTSGNQGYRHFFYQMCEMGYTPLMLDVLRNREYPGWGYMLENGATTIWERWENEIKAEMHSQDHPMFTAFDGIFYRYVAGIRIDDDACGCDKITIKPCFETGLDNVNCTFETVRGAIVCNWEKAEGKYKVHIEIPPTVQAKFDFGTENKAELRTSGIYDLEIIR